MQSKEEGTVLMVCKAGEKPGFRENGVSRDTEERYLAE